jgi:nucleosome binding factor SPN SPT16 subunit
MLRDNDAASDDESEDEDDDDPNDKSDGTSDDPSNDELWDSEEEIVPPGELVVVHSNGATRRGGCLVMQRVSLPFSFSSQS